MAKELLQHVQDKPNANNTQTTVEHRRGEGRGAPCSGPMYPPASALAGATILSRVALCTKARAERDIAQGGKGLGTILAGGGLTRPPRTPASAAAAAPRCIFPITCIPQNTTLLSGGVSSNGGFCLRGGRRALSARGDVPRPWPGRGAGGVCAVMAGAGRTWAMMLVCFGMTKAFAFISNFDPQGTKTPG